MSTYCFCIVGWYFMPEFLNAVYEIPADKFIISHREPQYVQCLDIYPKIKNDIYFQENKGLDWGAYHQFNALGFYENYDFVIYCHDDLVIKDKAFVEVIKDKFRDPTLKVIGNGRNGKDAEFRFGKYKDRMFFRDRDDFIIRSVRGSFFAAKTEIFSVIGNFPVHWKAKTLKKGNISLRNFAYLVCKHFGIESITYLDDKNYLNTKYLYELKRGETVA